jgi:hypothetical protein
MLKITVNRNETHTTLVLEGQLVDPFLPEFERVWTEARSNGEALGAVIDLKDVTSISERGQELLEEMMTQGAKFHCLRGVLTMHVVKRMIHGIVSKDTKDGNR